MHYLGTQKYTTRKHKENCKQEGIHVPGRFALFSTHAAGAGPGIRAHDLIGEGFDVHRGRCRQTVAMYEDCRAADRRRSAV